MTVSLIIRGFAGPVLKFQDELALEEEQIDAVIPALAVRHVRALVAHELHMIEIEFLDEPDPLQRFFRLGTDPTGMVAPAPIPFPLP